MYLVKIGGSSSNVMSLCDQFNGRCIKQDINHLLMNKIVFPWSRTQLDAGKGPHHLPLAASCPVFTVFTENSSTDSHNKQELIFCRSTLLQLRQGHLAVYDPLSEQILASCPCSLDLIFSIHQGYQIPEQQRGGEEDNSQPFSVLRFAHRGPPQPRTAFLVRAEDKKTLEQFRTALEKCCILQKDFHRKFKPLRKLGKGATAAVYSAVRLDDSSLVAVKAFNKSAHFSASAGKGKEAFEKEVHALASCAHQNLCNFAGVFETDNSLYLIMDAYDRSLSALLHARPSLPRPLVVALLEQLLRGVAHLHARGLMHRDLKLENIMLKKTSDGVRAVIIDMGMAESYAQETYLFEHCGTPGYAAPEIFGPRPPCPEKCDVFSLGVVFHILLFRKAVFAGANCAEVCANNRAGRLSVELEQLQQEDELVRDLLMRMLELDNRARISAAEALEHELFAASVKTPLLTSAQTEVETSRTLSLEEV